ncbi:MAG TPA: AAA family ATPase, partial [Xanthobacteraceae bacterium]|nr:AAA family ATPase [Xanthobacteraceae bacterium]
MKTETPAAGEAAGAESVGINNQELTASSQQFQSHHAVTANNRRAVDDLAHQFLRLILPDRGHYVAWIKTSDGRKYNRFASTIEELWTVIKEADGAGHAAYHGCASFKEARCNARGTPPSKRRFGRKKQNVFGGKSLWLDVDAGPGKRYPDCLSAEQAVAKFCKATGLPVPLCVRSGLGLHVYWPLQHVLDPGNWERYARGLKALCVEYGLHADPTRTADITSVLRTPGTHHRKADVRQVECLELVGPYSVEQFKILLLVTTDNGPKLFDGLRTGCRVPPYLTYPKSEEFTERLARNLSSFKASSGALIADRCGQIRALRDEKGNLAEPLWYSGLGVLAFAEDGDSLGHEWSSGDPRYTQQETQERLDRVRQFGPTTCEKFHEINAQVCERCPWWGKIRSPIVLGRDDDANQIEGKSGPFEIINATVPVGQDLNAETTPAPVPFPLRWHGEKDPSAKRLWLVKHLLPQIGVGLIAGQWGTAKTFVALDL